MTAPAPIGHNNPPDPIDEALAPFDDLLSEVANWADGEPVTDDASEMAVDHLIREMKAARARVEEARKATTEPLHKAWKAEVARWKPTTDDLDRQQKCLVDLVAPYKAAKLRQVEEAQREARRKAWEAEEAARKADQEARAGDLEAARLAAEKQREFEEAQAQRKAAEASKVKGLRTVTSFEITDIRDALRFMFKDEEGMAMLEDCARVFIQKRHKTTTIPGVVVTTRKEAF